MIQSTPPGAKVYMDHEIMGETPYTYSDTKVVGSRTLLVLKKEGYKDFAIYLDRNEEADVGAIIGGLFLWVPFLWVMKYKPTHHYELVPVGNDTVPANATKPNPAGPNSGTKVGNSPSGSQPQSGNSTNELIRLKNLLDQGAITTDDFTTLKVRILNDQYDYKNNTVDQITKLKSLLDATLLTPTEYKSQKDKLVYPK